MKQLILSIMMIMTMWPVLTAITGCNKSGKNTEIVQDNVNPDGTVTVANPAESTDLTKDIGLLITGLIGLYEVIVRIVKTKSNLSIIDLLWAIISIVLPNKKKSTSSDNDVHINF